MLTAMPIIQMVCSPNIAVIHLIDVLGYFQNLQPAYSIYASVYATTKYRNRVHLVLQMAQLRAARAMP